MSTSKPPSRESITMTEVTRSREGAKLSSMILSDCMSRVRAESREQNLKTCHLGPVYTAYHRSRAG